MSSGGLNSTVAGGGSLALGDGGSATTATLNSPYGVATDSAGNIYIADKSNHRVRRISSNGAITTVAGNGGCCSSGGDGGSATNAELLPNSIAFDTGGGIRSFTIPANALDASITSNMAIVPTSSGVISAFPSNPVQLILDIFGYFAP